jgi:dihydropteroate synthase
LRSPENTVSFRILQPNPFDFRGNLIPSIQLHIVTEFSLKTQALEFEKTLRNLSPAKDVHVQFGTPCVIAWDMSLPSILSFSESLKNSFPDLAFQMKEGLSGYTHNASWNLPGRNGWKFHWNRRTQMMGILNVTPDSFSDGGRYLDPQRAVERALQMQEEGADWIDVGGESTRPGAGAVSISEEKRRVLPVIKACAKALHIPLSVDTYKSEVALSAVGEGARMVNDIGALGLDSRMGKVLARLKVPVILMHMRGKPKMMQKNPKYKDVIGEILTFFRDRLNFARECGISTDRLLIDPGFGFGKSPWHNIEITRRLWELKVLGRPLVIGPSRKSTLGVLLGGLPPEERVEATGAAITASILKGADFVRVHDVKTMVRVVKIADAIRYDRGLKPL